VTVGVVAGGCSGGAQPSSQASHRRVTTTTRARESTTPSSTTTTAANVTTTTARPGGPGVLADCTAPAAQQSLDVEPSSITVACADAGIGARDLAWSTWGASGATAVGVVWENDCTPSCAAGTIKRYPAAITLSNVQPSRDGPTFTAMTATYSGPEPNDRPIDTFTLELPLG
jgi:hypothetical protein